jgi:DNA-directed RNA polymerase subunit RPC12/RpoP
MPKCLYFSKRSERGPVFRCAACGQDFPDRQTGVLVRLGSVVLGVVCPGCEPKMYGELGRRLSSSFPDCDPAGNLLGDF